MLINAKVTNKVAKILKGEDGLAPFIVCHNKDYKLSVSFDAEWASVSAKIARFIWVVDGKPVKKDVPVTNNEVAIPEVARTKELFVGFYAAGICTTTPGMILCKTSILCEDADEAGPGGGSTSTSELEDKVAALEQQMAALLYVPITVTSFANDAGTKEYGQTVNSVTLSWTINKTPTALTLDGAALGVAERSKVITGLSITWDKNKTWRLVATDERGRTSEKTTSITFCNGVYHGVGSLPASYDSMFVRGLTKDLRSNKKPSFTETAGAGQYIFYCLPKRMGTCKFNVGGFDGGFELAATIPFTNASGYTEEYYIYKSVEHGLGETTVGVS